MVVNGLPSAKRISGGGQLCGGILDEVSTGSTWRLGTALRTARVAFGGGD